MDRSSIGFVITAYALTWATLLAYTVSVHRRLAASRRAHAASVARAAGEAP